MKRNAARGAGEPSFRHLAMQLHFDLGRSERGRCLLFTSPRRDPASTKALLGFAHFLAAEQGHKVLVVDAGFGHGELSRMFEVAEAPGLLDLLEGTATDLPSLLVPTTHRGVHLLPLGRSDAGLTGLLTDQRLRGVLEAARAQFDDVLLAGAPILEDAAALALPVLADCVLLLSVEGETRLADLDHSQESLRACQAARVGLLLVARGPRPRAQRNGDA